MRDTGGEGGILRELMREEERLQFESFGYDEAFSLGMRIVQLAGERNLPIATVVMLGDQRVFHAGLAGSSADNDAWLDRKVRVVRRFGHSSLAVGTEFRSRGRDFDADARLDTGLYAAHGGSFPLRMRGTLVGVAAVSGLAQRDDHALVVEAITRLHDANVTPLRPRGRRAMAGAPSGGARD